MLECHSSLRAPLDPSDSYSVFLSVIEVCTKQDFVVGDLKCLTPTCVPVVVASELELASIFAVESDLEDESFTLLEDHLNLLDVRRQHTSLGQLLCPTDAGLAIAQGQAQAPDAHVDL